MLKGMDKPPDPTATAEEATEVGLRTIWKRVERPPNPTASVSATWSNLRREEAGVSRRHSSPTPVVMDGTR